MATVLPARLTGLLRQPSVLLNVVAPVIAFRLLARAGMSETDALALSAAFPAIGGALVLVRRRHVDPLAALVLTAIAVGLIGALVFHSGRLLLIRDALTTGVLGVVFLGSLLAPRPMVFTLRRRLSAPDRPDALATRDASWRRPSVRGEARRTTALWGVALLVESALHVGLSYVLPATTMVTVAPLLAVAVIGPLAVLTLRRADSDVGQHGADDTVILSTSDSER